MTATELADQLGTMYRTAPEGEMSCMVHLFGIKFAQEIKECGCSCHDIAKAAGISEPYGTEIAKGIKLAKYVRLK